MAAVFTFFFFKLFRKKNSRVSFNPSPFRDHQLNYRTNFCVLVPLLFEKPGENMDLNGGRIILAMTAVNVC